jgi:uncharacterized protein (DUF2267 family)
MSMEAAKKNAAEPPPFSLPRRQQKSESLLLGADLGEEPQANGDDRGVMPRGAKGKGVKGRKGKGEFRQDSSKSKSAHVGKISADSILGTRKASMKATSAPTPYTTTSRKRGLAEPDNDEAGDADEDDESEWTVKGGAEETLAGAGPTSAQGDTPESAQVKQLDGANAALRAELSVVRERLEAETARAAELEEMLGLGVYHDTDGPAALEIEQLQASIRERDHEIAAREDAIREKDEVVQELERRIKGLVLELTETRSALSSAREATVAAVDAPALGGGSDMHLPSTLCDSRSGGHSRSDGDVGRESDDHDAVDGVDSPAHRDGVASRVEELERALDDASLELTAAQQIARRKEQWLHNSVRAHCEMQRKYFHLKVKLQSVGASEGGDHPGVHSPTLDAASGTCSKGGHVTAAAGCDEKKAS